MAYKDSYTEEDIARNTAELHAAEKELYAKGREAQRERRAEIQAKEQGVGLPGPTKTPSSTIYTEEDIARNTAELHATEKELYAKGREAQRERRAEIQAKEQGVGLPGPTKTPSSTIYTEEDIARNTAELHATEKELYAKGREAQRERRAEIQAKEQGVGLPRPTKTPRLRRNVDSEKVIALHTESMAQRFVNQQRGDNNQQLRSR